jgi:DNA topoisomerase III
MRLWIAEKPNVGRAIAKELPGPQRDNRTFIECGAGNVVAWCVGHVLEQAAPEQYDEQLKVWRLEHLPIVPARWLLVPKQSTRELFETLKKLVSRATTVVHAGDEGREGQLLVDEVLEYCGYEGPVERFRTADLNPPAIRKAIGELQPNQRYFHLSQSALARQRADWLYGMNLSRLYTVKGREGGLDCVLSVGRVQTPVLGLVVERDREIENFRPKPYYVLRGRICSSRGDFPALWKPGAAAEEFLDPEGRLISRDKALQLVTTLSGQHGSCTKATTKRESQSAPLPYNLVDLQVDAERTLALTAQQTLDACQSLYEVHRLTTYPRSDCKHLPEAQFPLSPEVLTAVRTNLPVLTAIVAAAEPHRRSRAWDDREVGEHHAIIPTSCRSPGARLTEPERGVYELICRRYVAQFYPPHLYNSARIEVTIKDELFLASGRQTIDEGWRVTLPAPKIPELQVPESEDDSASPLPPISEGDPVIAAEVVPLEKKTKPPRRFTDGSLLQAMTGIARFVADPQIKSILKERDGIGTDATRAGILETLCKRGFLQRAGRHVVSMPLGRMLIVWLPRLASSPDLTAVWELGIKQISLGKMTLDQFMRAMLRQLTQLIDVGKKSPSPRAAHARTCPTCGTGVLRQRRSKKGNFVGCSRWPECKFVERAAAAEPAAGPSVG